jgi:hypothetical protein
MSKGNGEVMSVTILLNTSGAPRELADKEVIVGAARGLPLDVICRQQANGEHGEADRMRPLLS